MSKASCNIIKDLLPSYMEDICSEDTKEFVENHLDGCEKCRALAEMMKKSTLVSERAEQKEIDYMKKLKRHIVNRNVMSFGLLLGFLVLGIVIIMVHYGDIPIALSYIIMPALMLASHIILSDYTVKEKKTKQKIVMGITAAVLIGYSTALEFLCLQWVQKESYPFGLQVYEIGPFLYGQFLAVVIVLAVIFASALVFHIKTGISYENLMNACVLGCSVNLVFISLLKRLDTLESFAEIRNQTFCSIWAEGLLIMGILYLLNKKRFSDF